MDVLFICFYMRNRRAESINISPHTFGDRFAHVEVKTMNEFKFYCSHCDQPLKCDPCHAGRHIQCPGCIHLIRIPSPPHEKRKATTPMATETRIRCGEPVGSQISLRSFYSTM